MRINDAPYVPAVPTYPVYSEPSAAPPRGARGVRAVRAVPVRDKGLPPSASGASSMLPGLACEVTNQHASQALTWYFF